MLKIKKLIMCILIPLCILGCLIYIEKNRIYTEYDSADEIFGDVYLAQYKNSLQ